MGVGSHRAPGRRCTGGRGTPGSEDVAGREAVTYVRGAVTAKVQGHNWVPIPSTDHMVNVGTPLPVPARVRRPAVRGRTGSSPTGAGGGGRRTRSSPGPGEPVAWRRGPARVRGNREHGGGDTLVNTGVPWPADVKGAWHRVLVMQTKLRRWAAAEPGRRFDDLFNLVYDPAFLVVAWDRVRSNRGGRTAGAGRGRPPRRAGAAHARRPVRSAPKGEVRAVHARAGAPQADPQGGRQGPQPGDPHHGGPDRSGVAETGAGADLRSRLPPVLVRVPAQKTGAGRDRRDTRAHLAARGLRVGFRGGHQGAPDRSHRPDGAGARARRGQADPGADTGLVGSRRPQ